MLVGRFSGPSRVTSMPPISTEPVVGATKPPMILSNVVLPQPDGPEDRDEVAALDLEMQRPDRDDLAVGLRDVAQPDKRLRLRPGGCFHVVPHVTRGDAAYERYRCNVSGFNDTPSPGADGTATLPSSADLEFLVRQLPAERRAAGRVFEHLLAPKLAEEGEIAGDRDVALVAVRHDALAALSGDRRDPLELGQAARHGHIRLRDVDLSQIEQRLIVEARRRAEIAAADRHAKSLEFRVPGQIVERQRRLDPEEAAIAEDRHERQAVLGNIPGRRGVDHQIDVCGRHDRGRRGSAVSALAKSSRQEGSATILIAFRPRSRPRSMFRRTSSGVSPSG